MKNLTGASGSFVAPRSMETGDDLNEANLDEVLQAAANRAEFLKAHVDALETLTGTTGVKRLRLVSSSAALKALTGMAADDIAMVTSTGVFGIYKFVASGGTVTDVAAIRYQATDTTGFWINAIYPLVNFAGGAGGATAQLNPSVLPVPNRVVSWLNFYESGSPLAVDSDGNWQDSGVVSSAISLTEGDKVDVTAHLSVSLDSASDEFELRLASNDGASAAISGTNIVVSPRNVSAKVPVTLRGQFAAQTTASHTILVQMKGPGGGPIAMTIGAKRSILGTVYRP